MVACVSLRGREHHLRTGTGSLAIFGTVTETN
jgi:hypothetical protein